MNVEFYWEDESYEIAKVVERFKVKDAAAYVAFLQAEMTAEDYAEYVGQDGDAFWFRSAAPGDDYDPDYWPVTDEILTETAEHHLAAGETLRIKTWSCIFESETEDYKQSA